MSGPINAIVTGGTGFIGSHLVNKLIKLGGKVVVIVRKGAINISRLPPHPNLILIEDTLENMKNWHKKLSKLNIPFHVFYHLAWNGVSNTLRDNKIQLTNIQPSIESLKLAKRLKCTHWVATGSQAEYGQLNKRISETDCPNPTTLYGATKLSLSTLTRVIGDQLEINTSWVRVFSIYGPNDHDSGMLTSLIKNMLKQQQPKLTKGLQLWDYLYVDDAVDALISLYYSKSTNGIYNLGSGVSKPLREIIKMARDLTSPSLPLHFGEIPYGPNQVMHLEANIDKLTQDTGWVPKVDLETGLKYVIEYLRNQGYNSSLKFN